MDMRKILSEKRGLIVSIIQLVLSTILFNKVYTVIKPIALPEVGFKLLLPDTSLLVPFILICVFWILSFSFFLDNLLHAFDK